MYKEGRGVRQDYAKAMEWYKKAANQGDSDAQLNLGIMYEQGQGVRPNKRTANEWYEMACDSGNQSGCEYYQESN